MKKMILITIICAFMSAPAVAAIYTTVSGGAGSEADLSEILDIVTNGQITSVNTTDRVKDNQSNPGDVYDQFWVDGEVDVTATALWWGNTEIEGDNVRQQFMYDNDIDGSSRTYVDPADWVSGNFGTFTIGSSDPFIMGVRNFGKGYDAWTRESLNNAGGRDRVVTFDVSGMDIYAWTGGAYDGSPAIIKHQVRLASDVGSAYILGIDTGDDTDFQDFIALIEGPVPVPVPLK